MGIRGTQLREVTSAPIAFPTSSEGVCVTGVGSSSNSIAETAPEAGDTVLAARGGSIIGASVLLTPLDARACSNALVTSATASSMPTSSRACAAAIYFLNLVIPRSITFRVFSDTGNTPEVRALFQISDVPLEWVASTASLTLRNKSLTSSPWPKAPLPSFSRGCSSSCCSVAVQFSPHADALTGCNRV